jgi:hypothetical protein
MDLEAIPVEKISAMHPEYRVNLQSWEDIELLFLGGGAIRAQKSNYLIKRPKELTEVYGSRLERFTYQNIVGPAIGWYQVATFDCNPEIKAPEKIAPYLENCNRSGVGFLDVWRNEIYPSLLKFGSTWALSDLPRLSETPRTLAEQKAAGGLNPYVVNYDPRQVINWAVDEAGAIIWAVAKETIERTEFGGQTKCVDRWLYFDREQFSVYEAEQKDGKPGELARRVDTGLHALSGVKRCPLRRFVVPKGLWLGDRVMLHAIAHLNMQNAHYWGLTMSCLPQLYIKGDFNDKPVASESSYYHIEQDGDIGYVEPAGTTYTVMADEIDRAREEIYRQMWLQAQGRSSTAQASQQSGYSKEQDMAPSKDILAGYGRMLKPQMLALLTDAAQIAGADASTIEITGFDFDQDEAQDEIETTQMVTDLGIESDTLKRELHKRVARGVLKDAEPALLTKIEAEIDAAPSTAEATARAQAELSKRMRGALVPKAA